MGSVFNRGTRDRPSWYGKFKDRDGKWRMVRTKQATKVQARRWIEEREARVSQGKPAIEAPTNEKTFAELASYWLENHSAAACTSHHDNVSRMKHLLAAFGRVKVSEITAQRADELKARMSRETKTKDATGAKVAKWRPNTINRTLALLRKCLNDAVRWDWLPHAPKVRLLPVPETDFEYLPRDETERLLSWARANAPEEFPLYATAIYTGARMGELYGLRWSDVDLDGGLITIRRSYDRAFTKSKKVRRVRINRQLSIILRDWRTRCPAGELVFARAKGGMRARERPPVGFEKHLTAARCRPVHFHGLRHTAASLMVMSGISLRAVQVTLGHSTIQVTERYAHLAPDFMEREADRLSLDVGGWGEVIKLDRSALSG
jgi:integrase